MAAAGVAAPPGVILEARACDAVQNGEPRQAEELLRLVSEQLQSNPALVGRALSLRLSPETPIADLAPALLGVGGGGAAVAARQDC